MQSKAKILVVEDEVIIALGLQKKLVALGYDVVEGLARSYKDAMAKVEETAPDLVLMDIQLEGNIDGIETANQIRAKFDTPVIYLSAYSDAQTLERAKSTEPYGYVLKPVSDRELRIAIEIALHRNQQQKIIRQQSAQQRLFGQLGQLALASDSLDEFFKVCVDRVSEILCLRSCEIQRLDESSARSTECADNECWVPIDGVRKPFGALVGTREQRAFTSHEKEFLKSVGIMLSHAVQRDTQASERRAAESALRSLYQELEQRILERTRELALSNEAAQSASRAKSAFLANMSHEIRTPLGAVLGFSELLSDADVSDSERTEYARAIKRNGQLLSSLINDILDLSKIEAGKLEPDVEDVALSETLADISSLLQLQASEKGIHFEIESDGQLPEVINTDPVRLRQILFNLVGNAIKFTDTGSVTLKITHRNDVATVPSLVFEVRDTGLGISEEQAARLFEPFTQADASTKRKYGGTGLGLVLSQRLAQMLGGDVKLVSSEPGKGSTFVATIKANHARAANNNAPKKDERAQQFAEGIPPIRFDGVKILLVDDAADNRLLVSRYIKLTGAQVESAENGLEALEMVSNKDYDVLLMDLQMPIMDGYEATMELRRRGFNKPIIALTAHALKEERLRCLASGFNDHLSKPISSSALFAALSHFVHSR